MRPHLLNALLPKPLLLVDTRPLECCLLGCCGHPGIMSGTPLLCLQLLGLAGLSSALRRSPSEQGCLESASSVCEGRGGASVWVGKCKKRSCL